MSLKDDGFRYVWRPVQRECLWCHPALVESADVDCTDMSDSEFIEFISARSAGQSI